MNNMKCKLLICFLDENNVSTLNAFDNFKPRKIVIIHEHSDQFHELYNAIKGSIHKYDASVSIESRLVDRGDYASLRRIILQYPKDDTVVDLTGGDYLYGLMAYKICGKEGYRHVFVDLDKKNIVDFSSLSLASETQDYLAADVEDFIDSSGGDIASDNTVLFDEEAVKKLMDYILQNYGYWKQFQNVVRSAAQIGNELNFTPNRQLVQVIKKLMELNFLDSYQLASPKWKIAFKNTQYKNFCTSGGWLEALVYHTVKDFTAVDDAKGGVKFYWRKNNKNVVNEADVLASSNGKFVYISCKDTSKYDLFDFNEVKVYSEQLGGEDVKQVLVATKLAGRNDEIEDRVKAMGIKLVIFDGKIERLKQDLKRAII